jgi:hypothetical protein
MKVLAQVSTVELLEEEIVTPAGAVMFCTTVVEAVAVHPVVGLVAVTV